MIWWLKSTLFDHNLLVDHLYLTSCIMYFSLSFSFLFLLSVLVTVYACEDECQDGVTNAWIGKYQQGPMDDTFNNIVREYSRQSYIIQSDVFPLGWSNVRDDPKQARHHHNPVLLETYLGRIRKQFVR